MVEARFKIFNFLQNFTTRVSNLGGKMNLLYNFVIHFTTRPRENLANTANAGHNTPNIICHNTLRLPHLKSTICPIFLVCRTSDRHSSTELLHQHTVRYQHRMTHSRREGEAGLRVKVCTFC